MKAFCGGTIVATIPDEAFVVSLPTGMYSASRAEIVAVENSPFGEVAVSIFDDGATFVAGDEISLGPTIFDGEPPSNYNKGSNGFFFFCTREQAEEYEFAHMDKGGIWSF